MTAIKAIYNRKTKAYDVITVLNANPLYCHEGYLVFDNVDYTIAAINSGRLVPSIKPAQRQALLNWLANAKNA